MKHSVLLSLLPLLLLVFSGSLVADDPGTELWFNPGTKKYERVLKEDYVNPDGTKKPNTSPRQREELWFNPGTKRYEKVLVENEPEFDLTVPKLSPPASILSSSPSFAQEPPKAALPPASDRVASAQMNLNEVMSGIAKRQRPLQQANIAVTQAEKRVADLEKERNSKDQKFHFLYKERIDQARGEVAVAKGNVAPVRQQLDELLAVQKKYENELQSAKAAEARDKKRDADYLGYTKDRGPTLDEALNRKPQKMEDALLDSKPQKNSLKDALLGRKPQKK